MAARRLLNREIKAYREKQIKKQKGICPLCQEQLLPQDAALDHCHKTGKVRAALHLSCNGAEGRILQWAGPRSRGDDPELFLKNLIKYWRKQWVHSPIHPKHGVPVKRRRRKRTRK